MRSNCVACFAQKRILLISLIAAIGFIAPSAHSQPGEPSPVENRSTTVTTGAVKANGITIAYESLGLADRETLLLIMGNGAQLTVWPVELCNELVRRGYRVVIYDNRDVGLSTKFDKAGVPDIKAVIEARTAGKPAPLAYTLDDMANDAVGLLDALGVKKAHIVGVSMGGMIAQLVAADHPEHVLSLTSIMSTSGNPEIPFPAKPETLANLPAPARDADQEAIVANALNLIRILAGPVYIPTRRGSETWSSAP